MDCRNFSFVVIPGALLFFALAGSPAWLWICFPGPVSGRLLLDGFVLLADRLLGLLIYSFVLLIYLLLGLLVYGLVLLIYLLLGRWFMASWPGVRALAPASSA